MKQTAVEWYNSKVIELMTQRERGNIDVLEFRNQLDLLFEQAKQMEKEQIVDAVKYGCSDWGSSKDAEQYYNGAFKSECYHPLTERKHTSDIHFECTICGYNNY